MDLELELKAPEAEEYVLLNKLNKLSDPGIGPYAEWAIVVHNEVFILYNIIREYNPNNIRIKHKRVKSRNYLIKVLKAKIRLLENITTT